MRRDGKINLIAVVTLAAIAGGVWWMMNYLSAYLDNLDVRDAVRGAYNECWHVPDQQLIQTMKLKVNNSHVGWHEEEDQFGHVQRVNGLGIGDDDIELIRDDVNKTISITITYKRKIYLWPWPSKNNVRWLNFRETKSGPIKSPEAW